MLFHCLYNNTFPKAKICVIDEAPKVASKPKVCSQMMQIQQKFGQKTEAGEKGLQENFDSFVHYLQVMKGTRREFPPHLNMRF